MSRTAAPRNILDYAPPADVDAEKMVLGSVLISPSPAETLATISERLRARYFHDDCLAAVLRSAETRPLCMAEPEYSAALRDLSLMLADCCGHHPDTYDAEWLHVLAVWQSRHIDAVTEGSR